MTTRPHDNGSPRYGELAPRPSERTELVRAAADGELTEAQERSLQEHLASRPEDQAVISFEQGLRRAIATSTAVSPPPALSKRIEQLAGADVTASVSRAPNQTLVRPSRWRNRTTRWIAVAASVGLVASAAYLGLRPAPLSPPPGQLITTSHRVALASFVGGQHEECAMHADMVASHFKITSLEQAPAALSKILGSAPDLGRLAQSGLTFRGAGPCAVPGRGRSVHMVFEGVQSDATPPALVSIFVQQDRGELRLEAGRTYRLEPKDQTRLAADIFVWKVDGFVYFLTSASKPAMDTARLALGVEAPSGDL